MSDTRNQEDHSKKEKVLFNSMMALVASVSTCALLQPLDVVRTRLQVLPPASSGVKVDRSAIRTLLWIARNEGVRGLYTGLGVTVVATGLSWAMFRLFFEKTRMSLAMRHENSSEIIEKESYSTIDNTVSSCLAGLITTTTSQPLWFIKSRLESSSLIGSAQAQSAAVDMTKWIKYDGAIDCFKKVRKSEGILATMRGLGSSIALVPHGVIQMVVYEWLRTTHEHSTFVQQMSSGCPPGLLPFFWGMSSKIVASTLTYPLQVVRARQQMQDSPFSAMRLDEVLRAMIKTEGVKSFYNGFAINIARSSIANGMLFYLYEWLRRNVSYHPFISSSSTVGGHVIDSKMESSVNVMTAAQFSASKSTPS